MNTTIETIYKTQLILFFKEGIVFRNFELITSLYANLREIFRNSEPQSVPIPDDAPPELPRGVWNDANTRLNFSKQSLTIDIDLPTNYVWETTVRDIVKKLSDSLDANQIMVDRIGVIIEMSTEQNLHEILNKKIDIDSFRNADEANISWLDKEDEFNVWSHYIVDDINDVKKIVFDINTQTQYKLSEQGKNLSQMIEKIIQIKERRLRNGM